MYLQIPACILLGFHDVQRVFHVQVMEDVRLLRSREHVEPIPTSKSPSIDVKLTQPHWLDVGRHLQQVYRHCIADKVCFPCYCKVFGHESKGYIHMYIHAYIQYVHIQCVDTLAIRTCMYVYTYECTWFIGQH